MQIPRQWDEEFERLKNERGVVMIIGGPDTGKTTFVNFLLRRLVENKRHVALVDGDMGQSTLGPPTTIGMACFRLQTSDLRPSASLFALSFNASPVHMQFVGSTSPIGHMLPTVIGVKKLVDKAQAMGAELVIVDTTGLVRGGAAHELKHRKIELVQPQVLIALQKMGELEPLLAPYRYSRRIQVRRLAVAEAVKTKSMQYRKAYREQRFREYFSGTKLIEISLKRCGVWGAWLGKGRRLNKSELDFLSRVLQTEALYGEADLDGLNLITAGIHSSRELYRIRDHFGVEGLRVWTLDAWVNCLVALNDESETLALGVVQKIDFGGPSLHVLTPLDKIEDVTRIYFGSLRVSPDGVELGKV